MHHRGDDRAFRAAFRTAVVQAQRGAGAAGLEVTGALEPAEVKLESFDAGTGELAGKQCA